MIVSLYVHVPFCLRRCRYCDFASAACAHGDPSMQAYANSLARLVNEARDVGLLGGVSTAYVGGGTPSMLGAVGLGNVIRHISAAGKIGELSFEANPESLGDDVLAAAIEAGATRVSIGVQSFDNRELLALGRVHDAGLAAKRVAAAVDHGLHVSLDLMCGIPHQTQNSWERSLQTALSLGVGHVSCYPLMIEPGTAMERLCEAGELPWPKDDTEADDMETAERVLGMAGLQRYEVASYACPGERCRHNMAYWTGVEYLGLGTAAASMLGRESYELLRTAVPSLPELAADTYRARLTTKSATNEIAAASGLSALRFDIEELTERESIAEDLMLAARMTDGLPPHLVARAQRVIGHERVDAAFDTLVKRGLLERRLEGRAETPLVSRSNISTENLHSARSHACKNEPRARELHSSLTTPDAVRYVPTHAGWLLGNELYGALWDLAG